MAFGWDTFDVEKQFKFYASYHNNPVNVAIHLLCIWPILATMILMLQYTPVIAATPAALSGLPLLGKDIVLNIAFSVTLVYMLSFILMERVAGGLASLLILAIYVVSQRLVAAEAVVAGRPIFQVALAIHVAAWILQFIGHGVFEGRAPALLDSLDQAFLTAPLFVFMEVLFFLGYRADFYKSLMVDVNKNVAEFKRQKAMKSNKKSK